MYRLPVADIRAMLAQRIESLAEHVYPNGHRDGLEWRVGSVHGEPGDSLAIHLGDSDKRGTWKDFASGEGGDPIALIRACFHYEIGEAVQWAKDWLGINDSKSVAPIPAVSGGPLPDDQKNRGYAHTIWQQSQPASGTFVETYLRSRGITIPIPPALRFHPSLKHRESARSFPGMVAEVADPDGTFMAIHRTYLQRDGLDKAFPKGGQPDGRTFDAKKALGRISGGAVHLAPAGQRLGLCEGIETGLSVMQCWPELPVWAALSAPGLTTLKLPDCVQLVLIFADADPADGHGRHPGQDAARRAASRFKKGGRTATIIQPPVGKDWNDLLLDGTLTSFQHPHGHQA